MSKFFVAKLSVIDNNITITGTDAHHISSVLRAKTGDEIIVCDGNGTDYICRVSDISKTQVITEILSSQECAAEPKVKITIFQGIPKLNKMEDIIQKSVELGVFSIVPVQTKRCVMNIGNNTKKPERWQKIAYESAKQCGRGIIPQIEALINFDQAVQRLKNMQCSIMAYENEKTGRLSDVINPAICEVGVLIGPEGGFDDSEADLAKQSGLHLITLGTRILRTQTVAPAILPVIMHILNEF